MSEEYKKNPGCDNFTRPEEISALSKYLKQKREDLESRTTLEKDNLEVPGRLQDEIIKNNFTKLPDTSKNLPGEQKRIEKLEKINLLLSGKIKEPELDNSRSELEVNKNSKLDNSIEKLGTRIKDQDLDKSREDIYPKETIKDLDKSKKNLEGTNKKVDLDNSKSELEIKKSKIELESTKEKLEISSKNNVLDNTITKKPGQDKKIELQSEVFGLSGTKDNINLENTKINLEIGDKIEHLDNSISKKPGENKNPELDKNIEKINLDKNQISLDDFIDKLKESDKDLELDESVSRISGKQKDLQLSSEISKIKKEKELKELDLDISKIPGQEKELELSDLNLGVPGEIKDRELDTTRIDIEKPKDPSLENFKESITVKKINSLDDRKETIMDNTNPELDTSKENIYGIRDQDLDKSIENLSGVPKNTKLDDKKINLRGAKKNIALDKSISKKPGQDKEIELQSGVLSPEKEPSDLEKLETELIERDSSVKNGSGFNEGSSDLDTRYAVLRNDPNKTIGESGTEEEELENILKSRKDLNLYYTNILHFADSKTLDSGWASKVKSLMSAYLSGDTNNISYARVQEFENALYGSIINKDDTLSKIPSYKLNHVMMDSSSITSTINSGIQIADSFGNPSKYLRWLAEKTLGFTSIKKTDRQSLLDATLAALVIARRKAEVALKTNRDRLPGNNSLLNDFLSGGIKKAGSGLWNKYGAPTLSNFIKTRKLKIVKANTSTSVKNRPSKDGDSGWFDNGNGRPESNGKYYTEKIPYISLYGSLGLETTLSELTECGSTMPSSVEQLMNYLKDPGSLITTANKYTTTEIGNYKTMTLDSNNYWELVLEPFVGIENGGYSYLPRIQEINTWNKLYHNVETGYSKWIPFLSFDLQKARLASKTVGLFGGEVTYPTNLEYTNEFRVTIVDDQYKSWKLYFERCMEASIYNSEPHSAEYYGYSVASSSSTATESNSPTVKVNGMTFAFNKGKAGYSNSDLLTVSEISNFKPDDHITAIDKTHLCTALYKNITFRCRVYCMTPQLSTISKYDLLLVLKDFSEDRSGDTSGGGNEVNVTFGIVGENPRISAKLPLYGKTGGYNYGSYGTETYKKTEYNDDGSIKGITNVGAPKDKDTQNVTPSRTGGNNNRKKIGSSSKGKGTSSRKTTRTGNKTGR